MLVDARTKLNDRRVREALEYSVFPDPDRLEQTLESYREDPSQELYGYEKEGELIGIIGFRLDSELRLIVQHLAVLPEHRGLGYGRGLILEAIELKGPSRIVAETDEDAVDFYRNIGFEVESLGERYPGVERFQCIYVV
ncbi:GNAT family N-acetyltransferase [Paenibacillaceae bacterium WGS1546]|uniref:GNAT family N-acetyltransferase n=1 Tax=Cohnella sp. WGS1546 TaxID=3366810 RepID=UPI00372D1E05